MSDNWYHKYLINFLTIPYFTSDLLKDTFIDNMLSFVIHNF